MDFTLTADQESLMSAIEKIAAQFDSKPPDFHGFALVSSRLEHELTDGEYFDIASIAELGPVAAAMAVERLARLPCTAEFGLSMLVRPQFGNDWPRPLAIVEHERAGRFVACAKSLLIVKGGSVGLAHPPADAIEHVESLFAYPMGRIKGSLQITPLSSADAGAAIKWSRIAVAAEISGLLHAAINVAVEHLTLRKQFGRPLGTFQALRHRMAECMVLAGGVRWLVLQAAGSADEGDAALAAFHAQDSATRVIHDVHQMLGAMGVTLEHSLHLWTYRAKALLSVFDGRGGQGSAVARHCFDSADH